MIVYSLSMTLHCGSDEISDDGSSLATPDDAPESDHEADDEMYDLFQ